MFKKILLAVAMMASHSAFAADSIVTVMSKVQQAVVQDVVAQGLDWKVGDENNYSVDMSIIKGTMKMSVREIGADGIWIDQNMELGFAGKQNASMLLDPNTGAVKKFIVNGKEQAVPENNSKPIEVKEDKITVPAGTFECIYAKLQDSKTNEISQAWINPEKVSVGGALKMIQPSQFGDVTILLTSFKRN